LIDNSPKKMEAPDRRANHLYECVNIVRTSMNLKDGIDYAQTVSGFQDDCFLLELVDVLETGDRAIKLGTHRAIPEWLAHYEPTRGWKRYVITHAVLTVALATADPVDGAVVAFHDASTLEHFAVLLGPCIPLIGSAVARIHSRRARSALCCAITHLHANCPELVSRSEVTTHALLSILKHTNIRILALTAMNEIDAGRTQQFDRRGVNHCMALLQYMHATPSRSLHRWNARCTELISQLFARSATSSHYRAFRVRLRVLPMLSQCKFPEESFDVVEQCVLGTQHLVPLTDSIRSGILSVAHMTERWKTLRETLSKVPMCVKPRGVACSLRCASGVEIHDAVVASDGYTYDRAVLEAILTSAYPISVVTREPLHPWFVANHALRG
jgi:hypothetical protein